MTVKELRNKLKKFPDDCIVLIPNENLYRDPLVAWYVTATNVSRGINEMDGFVIIDDDTEDEDE